jgi:hypothetical protein
MKFLAATAALLVSTSAQTETCQRGWFRYSANADTAGYDGAVDFKACTGRKYATSAAEEYGRWYACSMDADNITDTTMYVYERYYDSFKCNDGEKINETLVGAVGDLNDAAWVATMQDMYSSMFMLFEEDDTYCDGFGSVECTIETNTIVEVETSGGVISGFVCDGVEFYREKMQFATRMCNNGQEFNCTAGDAFDWTIYENSDCTGSSNTYEITSGCMDRIMGVMNQTIVYDTNSQDEIRVLKCHAAPILSAVTATLAALVVALTQ